MKPSLHTFFFCFMDTIRFLDETQSTNEDAYRHAIQGAPHGFSIVAKTQTKGKGRLGRAWACPANSGLLMSTVLRPNLPLQEIPRLTLTAGVALCKSIEKLTEVSGFGLKWPNDLFFNGKKCGGILVETSPLNSDAMERFAIVGIGVNVNSLKADFPFDLQDKVTSLTMATDQRYSITEIAEAVRASLLKYIHCHEERGFEIILNQWRALDCTLGKEMEWVTPGKDIVKGKGMGPDASGQLLVQDEQGTIHKVLSGDVLLKR